jgi:hypothetical protein
MITTTPPALQLPPLPAPLAPAINLATLSRAVDEALKANCFCDVERHLIVQIVCGALLPETAPGRDLEQPRSS